MDNTSFNLDAFLKDAEKKINPNLSDNVNKYKDAGVDALPDVDQEKYVKDLKQNMSRKEGEEGYIPGGILEQIPSNYASSTLEEFSFEGEKVSPSEVEDALEILTDEGYERDIMRFYAKLVEYNKALCEPILNKDQLVISNIGMLQNPIEIFISRRMLNSLSNLVALNKEQLNVLKDIRAKLDNADKV